MQLIESEAGMLAPAQLGPALIGVLPFVERRQQCVQNTVIALEYLIEEHNVGLRNFACGLHDRFARMQRGDGFAIRSRSSKRSSFKFLIV